MLKHFQGGREEDSLQMCVALWEWGTEQDEIKGKKRVNKEGVFSPGLHPPRQVRMCCLL